MNNIDFATIIPKFDAILKRGLCKGVGSRDGQMCIEAAICAALDLPHGDDPDCVAVAVRAYKIRLNDAPWSSPEARAKGLRDLGIAQIGSRGVVDDKEFATRLAIRTVNTLLPQLLLDLDGEKYAVQIDACRSAKDLKAAAEAAEAAAEAAAKWAAAKWAAAAAKWEAAAEAAAAAAEAAAEAAAKWAAAAEEEAAEAAEAAAEAAAAAAEAAAAEAAAAAAEAAAAAAAEAAAAAAEAAAEWAAASDKYLLLSASIALEILRELKSPGCEWIEAAA